nr:hypothetical protein [uncultured Blautia sp.]
MYQKYVNSVPLYHQESDWKHLGIALSRAPSKLKHLL